MGSVVGIRYQRRSTHEIIPIFVCLCFLFVCACLCVLCACACVRVCLCGPGMCVFTLCLCGCCWVYFGRSVSGGVYLVWVWFRECVYLVCVLFCACLFLMCVCESCKFAYFGGTQQYSGPNVPIKNPGIYSFLCMRWVLISMAPRNSKNNNKTSA